MYKTVGVCTLLGLVYLTCTLLVNGPEWHVPLIKHKAVAACAATGKSQLICLIRSRRQLMLVVPPMRNWLKSRLIHAWVLALVGALDILGGTDEVDLPDILLGWCSGLCLI